jgi:hypothetical protein
VLGFAGFIGRVCQIQSSLVFNSDTYSTCVPPETQPSFHPPPFSTGLGTDYGGVIKIMYRHIILPVVYGCEMGVLTFRAECRLRVFGKLVLRKYFGLRGTRYQGTDSELYSSLPVNDGATQAQKSINRD